MNLYPIGELHGLVVLLTFVVVMYSDHQGWLYFRGKKATLSSGFVTWSHRLVWLGLGLIMTTGVILFSFASSYYATEAVFYVKMAFVGVLIMNGLAIGSLSHKSTTTPFSELSSNEKKTLLVSGTLSFSGWVGAATIGFFLL